MAGSAADVMRTVPDRHNAAALFLRPPVNHRTSARRPPHPPNQPQRNNSTNITAMLDVAHGTKPINNMTAAARINPAGRKTRGFERSDTEPIINFENHKRWKSRTAQSPDRRVKNPVLPGRASRGQSSCAPDNTRHSQRISPENLPA